MITKDIHRTANSFRTNTMTKTVITKISLGGWRILSTRISRTRETRSGEEWEKREHEGSLHVHYRLALKNKQWLNQSVNQSENQRISTQSLETLAGWKRSNVQSTVNQPPIRPGVSTRSYAFQTEILLISSQLINQTIIINFL